MPNWGPISIFTQWQNFPAGNIDNGRTACAWARSVSWVVERYHSQPTCDFSVKSQPSVKILSFPSASVTFLSKLICCQTPVKTNFCQSPVKTNFCQSPVKTNFCQSPIKTNFCQTPVKTNFCQSPVKTNFCQNWSVVKLLSKPTFVKLNFWITVCTVLFQGPYLAILRNEITTILTPLTSEGGEWGRSSRFSFWRYLITNPQC